MPTPEFIVTLRQKIGHDPLWLVGVTGYIEDPAGRILLGRRADTGKWALVSGINEPGEEPADTIAREALEETGVSVTVNDLASVRAGTRTITCANGDKVRYLDILFCCTARAQDAASARVADEESLEVGWFLPDALPEDLSETSRERIALARAYLKRKRAGDAHAQFWGGKPQGEAADETADGAADLDEDGPRA